MLEPLTKKPIAPKAFNEAEKAEWSRLWKLVLPLRKVTAADVMVIENLARLGARITKLFADENLKASTLVSLLRLQKELLKECGLTPAARDDVPTLAEAEPEDDPLKEFD